jgi:hypothetical protein
MTMNPPVYYDRASNIRSAPPVSNILFKRAVTSTNIPPSSHYAFSLAPSELRYLLADAARGHACGESTFWGVVWNCWLPVLS